MYLHWNQCCNNKQSQARCYQCLLGAFIVQYSMVHKNVTNKGFIKEGDVWNCSFVLNLKDMNKWMFLPLLVQVCFDQSKPTYKANWSPSPQLIRSLISSHDYSHGNIWHSLILKKCTWWSLKWFYREFWILIVVTFHWESLNVCFKHGWIISDLNNLNLNMTWMVQKKNK